MSRFANALTLAALAGTALGAAPAGAARGLAVQDSFRIGTAGVLCTAQVKPLDPALKGMFDRGYGIVCRDAAAPVGALYALRGQTAEAVATLLAARGEPLTCAAAAPGDVEGLGAVSLIECSGTENRVAYRGYGLVRAGTLYASIGLGGYDSALKLGLRSLVSDRPTEGAVEVATTAAGDPAAFARVQAGALDADAALAQAYERNNSGSFAESAQFFETLTERTAASAGGRPGEYLVGQAIQQSNLGNFAAAERLFTTAEARGAAADPISGRLLRNYRAIHQLNQRKAANAIAMLDQPVAPVGDTDDSLSSGVISPLLSEQINGANAAMERIGGVDRRLRLSERAAILDGQAEQLRGIALRQQGKYPQALQSLERATRQLAAVRDGRVASTAFMRSESFAEMALIAEAQADYAGAERDFSSAAQILESDYPQSAAGIAAKARLAGYLARRGQADRALALYGEVVAASARMPGSAATMRNLLAPYFALLAPRVAGDAAAEAMFAATQILVRPGVAQTQAVLARELSGGNDEAASLFRQSVTLSRDVARGTGEVARLVAANPAPDSAEARTLADTRARLAAVEGEQTGLLSRLAQYPRYRVLAPASLTIAELRQSLRPDEAYYLLRVIGQDVYAMIVTPTGANAVKAATTADALDSAVARLRDSIVTVENGVVQTYPFDLALARKLYVALFEPLGTPLAGVNNLIYEPDGPMLQLPATLLVTEQAAVDAYAARIKAPGADEFDMRGVAWLGRDRNVTTAVSPRSFVDVRAIAPAKGKFAYLGLGHNAIPNPAARFLTTSAGTAQDDCAWPLAVWRNPIAATELTMASGIIGQSRSAVLTDAAFTDTALKARDDLNQYRVLHFATHGLVTAPRPQCPARPALVTSFGDDASDGLLSFREIYDLNLDADVVVLSACDTAGMATIDATREAGITTGGNFALDGLVRAFVGAGARSLIASHWPIPDDYDATKRLMFNLFNARAGTPMATALRNGQRELRPRRKPRHPFYWAAFAVIGDGEQPLVRAP